MNTQTRYRTLVSHLAKVYAAEESARTIALHEGLDEIVAKLQPDGAGAWKQVKADSQRLLKVWMARETRPADAELASQILDALDEFAMDAAIVSAVAAVVVTPPEPAPVPAPVVVAPVAVAEKKPSPAPVPAPVVVAPVAEKKPAPAPVLIVEEKVSAPTSSVIQHVEEEEEEVEVEEEVEEEEEEEAATVEEEVEVEEEEVEAEEEVVEPEEEEAEEEETEEAEEETPAEEEGMEVEKKIFRGRAYWMDVHTNKLYAVIGDDDVGDEVGKVVEGRPVFLATTR